MYKYICLLFIFYSVSLKAADEDAAQTEAAATEESGGTEAENAIQEVNAGAAYDNDAAEEAPIEERDSSLALSNTTAYIGVNIGTSSDISFKSIDFNEIINPLMMLNTYSGTVSLGIEPFRNLSYLKWLRAEVSYGYYHSHYDALIDEEIAGSATSDPGKIILKHALMVKGYIDLKYFGPNFYPYIGFGAGVGSLHIIGVDTTIQQDVGLGEGWSGKGSTPVFNAMLGITYFVEYLGASFSVEYSYLGTGSVDLKSRNLGDPDTNIDKFLYSSSAYSLHTLGVAIKKYLN